MMPFKSPTINDIKKRYEYKLDPFETSDTAIDIHCHLYSHFYCTFLDYSFNERIKEIKKTIHNKRDKIDKNILESFGKTLKEISDGCEKMIKKVGDDTDDIGILMGNITYDYKENKDKRGAQDIYLKIGRDILDKEVNMYIKYEKILISYNEHIINIKKNLTN